MTEANWGWLIFFGFVLGYLALQVVSDYVDRRSQH